MNNKTYTRLATHFVTFALLGMTAGFPVQSAAAENMIKVKLAIDEDPIVPRLASSLGFFKAEGIEIVPTKVESFSAEDYLLQKPLIDGKIDASYHWFNHTVFGARHQLPVKAVMVFNDAPGMTIMVAKRSAEQIKSAADFKGKNIAEGAGYGTKSVLTGYLAKMAGLPAHSYTAVMLKHDGREKTVIEGLKKGKVDVMTFQEPTTSALHATGMVTDLYDLNSKATTTKVLGAPWPAQSLLMAPSFIEQHPETVQRLVNAFVHTMRFINTHTADQIVAKLPADYFKGKNRKEEINYIKNTLSTFASGDYSFSPAAVQLVLDSVRSSDFDKSAEGKWRGTGDITSLTSASLYDNRFVLKAQAAIK